MRKIFMNFGKTALVFAAVVAMAAGCRKDEIPVSPEAVTFRLIMNR